MIQNNYLLVPVTLVKRAVLGAIIGLAIILFFVLSADRPHPEWGQLWMIRPLLVVPLAGAGGGFISYLTDTLGEQGGWKKAGAIALSVIVFVIALWLGIVLGLAGTMWN
ncbi:hypothetical protein [Mucilaginibacter panaciglaebae]